MAGDAGRRAARGLLPPRRGRKLLDDRPASDPAAHVSRGLSRPRERRLAGRVARAHGARVVIRGYPQAARIAVEMLTIQNPQTATFSSCDPLARSLHAP